MTDFIIFGEILFDVFGDTATLGGAPLNVAAHLTKLGLKGRVVSAVGRDALGKRALSEIRALGLDESAIATLDGAETGRADVVLTNGNADFVFNDPAAWDLIPYPEPLEHDARLVYFGSLAQRYETSRGTLEKILKNVKAEHIFYDVNIRKNFYSEDIVRAGLSACTILKMNDDEQPLIERLAGCGGIDELMSRYDISLVLLTEGKRGSTAIPREGVKVHVGTSDVPVVDTVGAGDSLSAGFLAALLKGKDIEAALRIGSDLANYVVSHRGAIPDYDESFTARLKADGII